MNASWSLEAGVPHRKYQLAAQWDGGKMLRNDTLPRSLVLNETIEDAVFESVCFAGLQAGDAVFRQTRWLDCRLEAAELSATRFEDSYFRGTQFVKPMLRAVVFDRCVLDRTGYELPDVPTAAMLRFDRCVFVDLPATTEKRWRDLGMLSDDCVFVAGTASVAAAETRAVSAPPSPTVAAPVRPTATTPISVPVTAPVSPSPTGGGRFAALER